MADVRVMNYDESYWDSPKNIWDDVKRNYEVLVSYDANYLQRELYEYQREDCGPVLAFLNKLKEIKDKLSLCDQTPRPRR